jgi:hypothetical protein
MLVGASDLDVAGNSVRACKLLSLQTNARGRFHRSV